MSTLREPARIEARIEATERWIASLRRRIVHGEEMLGALRDELAATSQMSGVRYQAQGATMSTVSETIHSDT